MPDKKPRTWYCGNCLTTFDGEPAVCPNLGCRSPKPAEGWGMVYDSSDVIDRHYRVVRRLATGGAGITYLAREVGSEGMDEGPELAVKVLYSSRDHGSYLRRLSQEAQILQELAHPHIVEYRGFVHRSGHSPYLVTRFEQGGSLLDHVRRRGALSIFETAHAGRQVLEALDRAHQVGVVHRDLKPENVLLEEIPAPGQLPVLRVADFGIAKVSGSFSDRLTRVGAFVGTPQYAAPEQFDGLPPTSATDVFAAGGLIYFCLNRQSFLPFADRMSPEDASDLLLTRLPPRLKLPSEDPKLVEGMETILAAAMAVKPEDRVSVREMERMLDALVRGESFLRPGPTILPMEKDIPAAALPTGSQPPPRAMPTMAPSYDDELPEPPKGAPEPSLRPDPSLLSRRSRSPEPLAAPAPVKPPDSLGEAFDLGPTPTFSASQATEPSVSSTPTAPGHERPLPPPSQGASTPPQVVPPASPVNPPAPARPKKKRSLLKIGCGFLVLAGLCAGVAIGGTFLFGVKNLPELPGLPKSVDKKGDAPVELTGTEADSEALANYAIFQKVAIDKAAEVTNACGLAEGVPVRIVVLPDGKVSTVEILKPTPAGDCVKQVVQTLRFPIQGGKSLAVKLKVGPVK